MSPKDDKTTIEISRRNRRRLNDHMDRIRPTMKKGRITVDDVISDLLDTAEGKTAATAWMDRASPAKSVFDLIKRGSLCPSCVGTHPEDPTGGEICYIRQVSIHEAPAECPDFESRKDPDDPCFGCPGVEGGCSEHPAECGRSAGRDA